MKSINNTHPWLAIAALAAATVTARAGIQTTGAPGSPSGTTTIDVNDADYLPPFPLTAKFTVTYSF